MADLIGKPASKVIRHDICFPSYPESDDIKYLARSARQASIPVQENTDTDL